MLEACEPKELPSYILGSDSVITAKVKDKVTKFPIDITSASEIKAIFLNDDGTFLEKLKTAGDVTILNGPGGALQIVMDKVNGALLKASPENGASSIEVHLTIAGKLSIVLLENVFIVKKRIFPAAP